MNVKIERNINNPIIKPDMVKPTRSDFQVDGVFNCGVAKFKEEVILLVRVAESVISQDDNQVGVPILLQKDNTYELNIKYYDKIKDSEVFDFSDSRSLRNKETHRISNLTSLSHFRIARSKDGVHFEVDEKPFIFPEGKYECWGIEDPRVSQIDECYYINYTAVSELGAATSLIKTKDFKTYERLGVIYAPENKDVTIFPEKINGLYYAYHRPVPKAIGDPNIWVSSSKDLLKWGGHEHLISVSKDDTWENGRIGGGAPSIKTDRGWIHIYHAADKNDQYCLGAFITTIDNPAKIIGRASEPILVPRESYEVEGFFGNVVFTCGTLLEDGVLKIYYGASDEVIGVAEITIEELYRVLGVE